LLKHNCCHNEHWLANTKRSRQCGVAHETDKGPCSPEEHNDNNSVFPSVVPLQRSWMHAWPSAWRRLTCSTCWREGLVGSRCGQGKGERLRGRRQGGQGGVQCAHLRVTHTHTQAHTHTHTHTHIQREFSARACVCNGGSWCARDLCSACNHEARACCGMRAGVRAPVRMLLQHLKGQLHAGSCVNTCMSCAHKGGMRAPARMLLQQLECVATQTHAHARTEWTSFFAPTKTLRMAACTERHSM